MISSLIIPTLGLNIQVYLGSQKAWNNRQWARYEHSVQEIIKEPNKAFKYPHIDVIGAHDYLAFSDLDELKYNDLIIYNKKRYRVKAWEVVRATDTRIINPNFNTSPITLMTCLGNRRFIVYASR